MLCPAPTNVNPKIRKTKLLFYLKQSQEGRKERRGKKKSALVEKHTAPNCPYGEVGPYHNAAVLLFVCIAPPQLPSSWNPTSELILVFLFLSLYICTLLATYNKNIFLQIQLGRSFFPSLIFSATREDF